MARRYLLDTNIASHFIKGTCAAVDRHMNRVSMAQVAISAVTEGELRYGLARRPEATRLARLVEDFLIRVAILPWDSTCALQYGRLRAQQEAQGTPLGNLDTMIAAQALAAGATLVSNDGAFRRIKGLKIEDWSTGPRR
jgi:tRNA(fMet)-specific endonuclease VapC